MKIRTPSGDRRLLWLTDPHLEKAPQSIQSKITRRLEAQDYDMALITGDLGTPATLPNILPRLAEACGQRQLFFVLGNHDFRAAGVHETLSMVDDVCRRHTNLTHLTSSGPVRITEHSTLVGHHGLTGATERRYRDGVESREKMRHGIFYAKKARTQLLAATHYPPFHSSVLFNGRPCDKRRQVKYCNGVLGYMLIKMASTLPSVSIRILAGHTHHMANDTILPNLSCRVGKAGSGQTGVQGIVMV